MKRFFVALLPFVLFLVFGPEQAQACGKHGAKTEAQSSRHVISGPSCCIETSAATDCCASAESATDRTHDCNGSCEGKCGGNCNCPCAHAGAVVAAEFLFQLYQPEPAHTGFSYATPFLSNVSLDIWLPPNIRA